MANTALLFDIPDKASDPIWLEENAQEVYEILLGYSRHSLNIDAAMDAIIYLMPHLLNREDVKRWSNLLEAIYHRTRFAEFNGFDGVNTRDVSPLFIMQKRDKVAQLPTKTKRRKRVILHPTQGFEIWLIMFLGRYLKQIEMMPEHLIADATHYARTIGDAYCNNKLHQALAFIYKARREADLALKHGFIAYEYWNTLGDPLEKGLSAYAISTSYQLQEQFTAAQTWITRAANDFAQTEYLWQHGYIALATASLKIWMAEFDVALQWASIALEEFERVDSPVHVATSYHYMGIAHTYLKNYGTSAEYLEQALDMYEALDQMGEYWHTQHSLAFLEAKRGDKDDALQRLDRIQEALKGFPQTPWRDHQETTSMTLREKLLNNEELPDSPL